jgi:hypothetical protein
LPLDLPPIDKLSDLIHHIRNWKSELNNLVMLLQSKSETRKADMLRLSSNIAYMVAQRITGTTMSTVEAKSWTVEEKLKFKSIYRDKELNPKE